MVGEIGSPLLAASTVFAAMTCPRVWMPSGLPAFAPSRALSRSAWAAGFPDCAAATLLFPTFFSFSVDEGASEADMARVPAEACRPTGWRSVRLREFLAAGSPAFALSLAGATLCSAAALSGVPG